MDGIFATSSQALELLLSGDTELWEIIGISFKISTLAILVCIPPALLLAFTLAYTRFPGRRLILSLLSTMLSIPAVVVGVLGKLRAPLAQASLVPSTQ